MTSITDAIDRTWEHIADADCASSADERRSALSAGMHEIETQLRDYPNSPDLKYHMAYLWYKWPDRTDDARSKTYLYLRDALEQDPEHVWARLYLGFQEFDDANYAGALATFQRTNIESLGAAATSWQRLKVTELVICCKLRLDWRSVTLGELERLRAEYESFKEHTEPPAPVEITTTAAALCGEVKDRGYLEIVEAIVRLIQQVEGSEGGALHKELFRLEACAAGHFDEG